MPKYVQLTVELPEAESERAQLELHERGALGLEVRDSESPPLPGVRAPVAGEALLLGSYDDRKKANAARRAVAKAFPGARLALEDLPEQDWSESWRARIRSVEVGRLWVGPPWQAAQAPREKVRVVVEPKMAFGTGDHPTTRLCLGAIDAFLAAHPGASVLDVGTGTGVLAIAAKKLGAGRVVGVDNDATSVELARECARANDAADVELSGKPLAAIPGTFELVVANILANTLVELAPALVPKVARRLVLAGVLAPQQDEVAAAYEARGLRLLGTEREAEWVRLDLERP